MARRPGPGKPFPKGTSGNPSGKSKTAVERATSIQALARAHTEEAIEALAAALKVPATRVAAATALLDRGYGRPVQTAHVRIIRNLSDLTSEELHAIATDVSGDGEEADGLQLH
jgi:hypothetical protein